MNDKYVAFLDILGFKAWLSDNDMYDTNTYMKDYSKAFRETWDSEDTEGIFCYMVSDCAVLHTEDVDKKKLKKLIDLSIAISKNLFSKTGILIRGAICKGDFENITRSESLLNFNENIFTGKAYVDAFVLEEKAKVAGIALSAEVSKDVQKYLMNYTTVELKDYVLVRYFTIDYLLNEDVFEKFIELAVKAKWIPHYHNTVYLALYKNPEKKGIFDKIFNQLEKTDKNKKGEQTKEFLCTAFVEEVDENYKKQLCTYLRKKILDDTSTVEKPMD